MRVIFWCALFLWSALHAFTTPQSARASTKSSPRFFLDVMKPADDAEIGLLIRELVRQSVLLTAREELRLRTCDASLRESVAAGSKEMGTPIDVSANVSSDQALIIRISKVEGKRKTLVKAVPVKLHESELIASAVAQLEPMSRREFREILGQCGYSTDAKAEAAASAPDVSEEIREHLRWPSVLRQYEAVRSLHARLRQNPDAPVLLAALARGYAHLGTLTEVHWSPMHKVFKARALLYAERLVARQLNTDSLCTRAYVRALAGLHQPALDDLATVLSNSNSGLSDEGLLAEAYCLDDAAALAKLAESKENIWAAYFQFIRAEAMNVYTLKFQAAQALLNREGDCFRVWDSVLVDAPLGVRRQTTESAPKQFATTLYEDLAGLSDLPDAVRALQQGPKEDEKELTHRQRLIQEMQLPRDADLTEPSLQTAGNLIQDITFLHAWRRVDVERFVLAVNADATLDRYRPSLRGHPYESFIESHASDEQVVRDALIAQAKKLVVDPHYETSTTSMLILLQQSGVEAAAAMRANVLRRCDLVFRDLLAFHRMGPTAELRQWAAQRLREICPNTPTTIAATVTSDWEYAASRAKAWEKEYATEPAVQDALGERYLLAQQWDDAARCLQRRIDTLPDHETYRRLALCYRNQDNEPAWLETMTKALKLQSQGLEDDTIRVELARHFMKREKLETAQKYADEAAESWAGWALQCAADCHDQMGDWRNAETYMKRLAERYEDSQFEWYCWCRRTGRGEVAAARELAKKYLQSVDRQQRPEVQMSAALFEYAEGHSDRALAACGFKPFGIGRSNCPSGRV